MCMLRLELHKFLHSKLSLVLLIFTVIVFPTLLKIMSHLTATTDNVPEGLFPDKLANAILAYSQSYFFIPIWILVLVGIEFSNGHVNKLVFIKSRAYYFQSKLLYVGLVTLLFTVLAALTFTISVKFSPYTFLEINPSYFALFILQFAASTLLLGVILMMLVFTFRSPIRAFLVYLGWTFIEGIVVALVKGLYGIHLKYLPMQIPKSLYQKYENDRSVVYFNAFSTNFVEVGIVLLFSLVAVLLFRSLFLKSELKPLTD